MLFRLKRVLNMLRNINLGCFMGYFGQIFVYVLQHFLSVFLCLQ